MFEVEDFLTSSNESVLDDKFLQIPPGDYDAQVAVGDKAVQINKGEKDNTPWAKVIYRFEILDPSGELEKNLGRKPGISYDFFLDLTETDPPKLDMAKQKNVRLGALLSATGTNEQGWKLTSPCGKRLKIKVTKVKGQDGVERSQVTMVGAA